LRLGLPRLPLTIFLIMILGSLLLGFSVIYWIIATHSVGENLRLENEFIKIDFPRSWIAYSWDIKNTSGNIYSVFLSPPQLMSAILFRIHDEIATQNFIKKNNLTDALSIAIFEAKRIYNWTQSKNENSSLIFKEIGGMIVLGNQANYSRVIIKDAIETNGAFYNMSFLMISYIRNQKLVEIAFWGEKGDCDKISNVFEAILNSTEIKV